MGVLPQVGTVPFEETCSVPLQQRLVLKGFLRNLNAT